MSKSFEKRGYARKVGPWGSLEVEIWGPERTDLERLKDSHAFPLEARYLDDRYLQNIIDGAKEWVGERRLSWTVVACNYLKDAYYHA